MSHLLDEKILETLTYERSKTWSNFLKICEVNENDFNIPLNKLEEVYKDQNEDDLDAIEEAVEEDVEDDIKSTTMGMTKDELTLMLRRGENKDILCHTLPIVEQHVRKWKEAGLDRILNTFDAQKIERHVGDWLRRHHSAYGEKNLIHSSPPKSCHKRHKAKSSVDLYSSEEYEDSEPESNHSFDTAHCVCECHKCRVSICRKCSDPMGTTGRYRKTPRKRAMYRCDELSEVQNHHHMQALIHQRAQRKRAHERKLRYQSMHNPYNYELNLNGQRGRKYLRQPRDLSNMYSSSSSSDDDCRDSRCLCSSCLRRTISQTVHPYHAYRSYQGPSPSNRDYHHRRSESARSTHSTLSYKRRVCKLCPQNAFEEGPLCSNGGHNVISTDELFVPKDNISHMIDKENMSQKEPITGKKQTSTTSTGKTMRKKRKKEQHKFIDKTIPVTNKKKKTNSANSDSDIELKTALEVSRETYLKEQKKFRQRENTSNITSHASTSIQLPQIFGQGEGTTNPSNIYFEASKSVQIPEKSSFSNQSVVCNPTTVFNQTVEPCSQNATIIELSSSDNSISEQASTSNIHSKRDIDCTLVTSTTGCVSVAQQPETTDGTQCSDFKITKNGILLYAPKQATAEKQAQANQTFMLTEQSLCPIIGERRARRFLKYHVGSRSFDSRYSVYYRPTARVVAMLSGESKSLDLDSSSSSGSEVDIFEQVDRYGLINTVLE